MAVGSFHHELDVEDALMRQEVDVIDATQSQVAGNGYMGRARQELVGLRVAGHKVNWAAERMMGRMQCCGREWPR